MNPHLLDPLARLREAAAAREAAGLRRFLNVRRTGSCGPSGACGPDGLRDLASNDYLGLCGDPRVIHGAITAALQWGTGSGGSRLVTGSTELHATLERELAGFTGAPAALVFSSGYLANLAAVVTLAAALSSPAGGSGPPGPAGRGVLIVSDAANHASLIDACRLSRARVEITPHADVAAVERALARRAEPAALVVSDTVFSVTGDAAPVAALHGVARAHHALLVLDEAHAFGVLGPGGRGTACAAGIAAEPDVICTLTLSKALAGQGGAVLGAAEVIGALIDTGRAFIFDTGLAPPCAGAAVAALRVLRGNPGLGPRAQANAKRLAGMAADLGLPVSPPDAAVVRVMLGGPHAALEAQRACAANGVRAGYFRPPSVPAGQSCLRLTGRANLTEADFAAACQALTAVRDLSVPPA